MITSKDAPISEATAIQSVAYPKNARTRNTALIVMANQIFCLIIESVRRESLMANGRRVKSSLIKNNFGE